MQEVELGLVYYGPEITEVVQAKYDTSEFSDTELAEPEVEEPTSEISHPESPSTLIDPTLAPPSP